MCTSVELYLLYSCTCTNCQSKTTAYTSSYYAYLCLSVLRVLIPIDGQQLRLHFQPLRIPLFICSYCTQTNWRSVITRTFPAITYTSLYLYSLYSYRLTVTDYAYTSSYYVYICSSVVTVLIPTDGEWLRAHLQLRCIPLLIPRSFLKGRERAIVNRRTLEPFQRQRGGNFCEMGWSAYGLFRAHIYLLELNWTELYLLHACTCINWRSGITGSHVKVGLSLYGILACSCRHACMCIVTAARCVGFVCCLWESFSIET